MDEPKKYAGGIRAGARPTTLNLDVDLHSRLKMLSAMTDKTMSDIVESWILFYAPVQTEEGMTWTTEQQTALTECFAILQSHRRAIVDEWLEAANANIDALNEAGD